MPITIDKMTIRLLEEIEKECNSHEDCENCTFYDGGMNNTRCKISNLHPDLEELNMVN